jgi:hypothetical protein
MNLYLLHNDPIQLPLYDKLFHFMDEDGNVIFCNEKSQWHRDNDLPAIIWSDGSQFWYVNGEIHRDNDLPAIIYANGHKEWWVNGKLHRDNGLPAVIYSNGRQEWCVNGIRIK